MKIINLLSSTLLAALLAVVVFYVTAACTRPAEITVEQYSKLKSLKVGESLRVADMFPGDWTEVCFMESTTDLEKKGYLSILHAYYYPTADPYMDYSWFVLKKGTNVVLFEVNEQQVSVVSAKRVIAQPSIFHGAIPAVECADKKTAKLHAYSLLKNKPIFLEK